MLDIVPKLDLDFSPYSGLYDIIVGKENMYRRLRDEMDWSFVNESMIECYDSDRGRSVPQEQSHQFPPFPSGKM